MSNETRNVYRIELEYDNAAFGETPGDEVARILKGLAEQCRIRGLAKETTLLDANGNSVGRAVREDS